MESRSVFSRFDLSQAVTSTLLFFEAILFENHISLDSQIQPDVFLNGDQESMKKAIRILMDNAIKNTGSNGSITVLLTANKNIIEMLVSNTGLGIPAEDLEKIFERFYRVDTSRTRENGRYG